MNEYDDLPFDDWPPAPAVEVEPKKCYRHVWVFGEWEPAGAGSDTIRFQRVICGRCGKTRDASTSRRNRLNGKRGRSDELVVANILGGRKVGSLGMSHDVEVPGYLRAQCKKLDRMPSLNAVIGWLDAIPVGPEIRAVTIADTPGPGGKTRRLIVMELAEFAQWHGRPK